MMMMYKSYSLMCLVVFNVHSVHGSETWKKIVTIVSGKQPFDDDDDDIMNIQLPTPSNHSDTKFANVHMSYSIIITIVFFLLLLLLHHHNLPSSLKQNFWPNKNIKWQ